MANHAPAPASRTVINCTCAAFFKIPVCGAPHNGLAPCAPAAVQRPKITLYPSTMAKSSTSSPAPVPALPASYEAALQELEGLAGNLESGKLPLDQLLTGYQRGAQLLKFCRDKLEAVETQIKVLEGTELKPWVQD